MEKCESGLGGWETGFKNKEMKRKVWRTGSMGRKEKIREKSLVHLNWRQPRWHEMNLGLNLFSDDHYYIVLASYWLS